MKEKIIVTVNEKLEIVEVTITDVKSRGFTINTIPEDESKIALYQYYVDNNLIYEGTEKSYSVTGLTYNTNYNVKVRVIPRTTVDVVEVQQRTANQTIIELANKFLIDVFI